MKTLKTFMALTLVFMLAVVPALAGLTVDSKVWVSLGNKRMLIAQVDFDDSYAYGGETFTYASYGFNSVDLVRLANQKGYIFEFDYTNSKFKVFAPAPAIVVDEVQTTSGNGTSTTATLNYPAAYIMAVSTKDGPLNMMSATNAQSDNEVGVELTEGTPGTRAVLSTTANVTLYVTYITQAWQDVFDNLVVDESIDLTSTGIATGYTTYTMAAVMYIDNNVTENGTPLAMLYKGDTVVDGSDAEASVDFSIGKTSYVTAQTAAYGALITYIKKPSSGFLYDRFIEDEAVTMASGAGATTYPVLIWGTAGYFLDNSSAAAMTPSALVYMKDALGSSNEGRIDMMRTKTLLGNYIQTNGTTATGSVATYIYGLPHEIPNLEPLEVINGTDLSDLTDMRLEVIGN